MLSRFEVHAAEVACPPLPAGSKPHLTGYVICDGNAPNCLEFELPEGGAKFLDLTTRVDLVVSDAAVAPMVKERPATASYNLDVDSVCRNKKFARKHQGKKTAVVGAGKILAMPPIDGPDFTSEIKLSLGAKSTYRENAETCLAIFPDCKTGNISWLNLKESGGRSIDKIYRAVAGEKSDQAD